MKLTKRNREAIATCLRQWAHLDIQTGAAKEAAGVKLDDRAMCLDIAELRIRNIEFILMNPRPCRTPRDRHLSAAAKAQIVTARIELPPGGGGAEQAGMSVEVEPKGHNDRTLRPAD